MIKRGQAALEFLTTYGWAFLVILIMVGALAYFGILKPSKLLPDRCNFGSEMGCVDYKIGTATLNLRLKNNIGEAIIIPAAASIVLSSESGTGYDCTSKTITGKTFPVTWNGGEILEFVGATCGGTGAGFVVGEKAKVFMTINYYDVKSGSAYTHQIAGEAFTTVT